MDDSISEPTVDDSILNDPTLDDSISEPTVDDSIVDKPDTAVNALNPAMSSGDFKGLVEIMQQQALSNDEKYLLTNHFFPSRVYKFPSYEYGKQKWSFQHNWLSHYNGLVHSESHNSGYCKYRVLFRQAAYSLHNFSGIRDFWSKNQPSSHFQFCHFGGSPKEYKHLKSTEFAEQTSLHHC